MDPEIARQLARTLDPRYDYSPRKLIADTNQHFKDHLMMGGKYNDKVGAEITERLAKLAMQDAQIDYASNRTDRYPPELREDRIVMILNAANALFENGVMSNPCLRVDMKVKIYDMPIGCYLFYKKEALNDIFAAARANVVSIPVTQSEESFDSAKHQTDVEARFNEQLIKETRNYCIAEVKELSARNGEPQFRVRSSGGMPDAIRRPTNQGCGCTSLALFIGMVAVVVYFAVHF